MAHPAVGWFVGDPFAVLAGGCSAALLAAVDGFVFAAAHE